MRTFRSLLFSMCLTTCLAFSVCMAQENTNKNQFRQLKEELATPNVYRNAAGAPGHKYWQQRADYDIQVTLDDENQKILGEEMVTYYNNSPDELRYLWVQLDQNRRAKDADFYKVKQTDIKRSLDMETLRRLHQDFDGGFKLDYVKDAAGKDLAYTVNKTMMRINLPIPLKPGGKFVFKTKWQFNINDRMKIGGRSGYEYFPEDDNYLYTIAQFYPRMAVYNEVDGWQNKQFLGQGEFTLNFGNFKVSITVPTDHVVAATGELQNAKSVLSSAQMQRMQKAKQSTQEPVMIIPQTEAEETEKSHSKSTKTWMFEAENVRDFAFASSRKFIWDAMAVKFGSRTVMAMSFYPKEGNPLWEKLSTKVVAHTLRVYSKYTFDYPYPVAQSIHAADIGMEYPMICFNFGRPEKDGTYTEMLKYRMLGVIIHEVGHNYFPMIVNSDERQWTWMDEGLNTFLQYLTEVEWDPHFPSRRGPAYKIVPYMSSNQSVMTPIMSNSESIYRFNFGNNAYGKPATALNILRETVLGRELFDYAFKEYAQRWMFKQPTPADFFRTMEDASGVDLDWFWRGWFYSTNHVDIGIKSLNVYRLNSFNPEVENNWEKERLAEKKEQNISTIRNKNMETYIDKDESIRDFYYTYDPYEVTMLDHHLYSQFLAELEEDEKALLEAGYNYVQIEFENIGGLAMPLILKFEYKDGTDELVHIPAEVWQLNNQKVNKVFPTKKEIKSVVLDPFLETADTDVSNNYWPPRPKVSRFRMYKERRKNPNPMQLHKKLSEKEDE